MIELKEALTFRKPELRIREYCEIEIYKVYDGRHNINNTISEKDVQTANKLYALINRYDKTQSTRLLAESKKFARILSRIPNVALHSIPNDEWSEHRKAIREIFDKIMGIKGFGLARATKILHLKRPELFPILDSYVVAFLLEESLGDSKRNIRIGMKCMELARKTIQSNKSGFESLQKRLSDLPIPLSIVRLFDILCWTTEKWDLRGITSAPYGTKKASKSLLNLN